VVRGLVFDSYHTLITSKPSPANVVVPLSLPMIHCSWKRRQLSNLFRVGERTVPVLNQFRRRTVNGIVGGGGVSEYAMIKFSFQFKTGSKKLGPNKCKGFESSDLQVLC
jgi:hypothetical protein